MKVRAGAAGGLALLMAGLLFTHTATPIGAAPSCYSFTDWSEDDPFSFDDKGHGPTGFDPNVIWPAEEWYFIINVAATNYHLSFERGEHTLEVYGHDACSAN